MRILLATDGSEDSRGATDWLRQLPLPATSSVLVVTVASDPTWVRSDRSDLVEAVHADAREVVETARRSLAPRWPETAARVMDGDPRSAILQASEDWSADLVVVGSRGLGAFAGMVLGSVSIEVARHASCAVLITKGSPRPVRTAVVAVDGSPDSLAAARWFGSLQLDRGLRVHLVAVAERPRFPTSAPEVIRPQLSASIAQIIRERTEELEKALGSVEKGFASGPAAVERAVVVGSPGDVIVDAAKTAGADLVVVGARGLGAFGRVLLGSVSERVVHNASCPVLIVKTGSRTSERDPSS
jgi:nucleotide-binding universal stress UspA family protein